MKDNPSRLGLISSLLNNRVVRVWPDNWHTPVDGVVTAMSKQGDNNYMFDVELAYCTPELVQTVKLEMIYSRDSRRCIGCVIV